MVLEQARLIKEELTHAHEREPLKKTSLHGSHTAADINFLAEMSLYGKFYELLDYLLFRRIHPGSSSWDRKNHQRQIVWSDPTRRGLSLDTWQATRSFFSAVRRCPAPFREKRVMYAYLLRETYWQRETLRSELFDAFRLVFRH
jgi:hypothetical protein